MKSLSKIPTALIFVPFYLLILIASEWSLRVWYPSRAVPNVIPDTQLHHAYRPNITFTTFPNEAETFPPAINEINSQKQIRGHAKFEEEGAHCLSATRDPEGDARDKTCSFEH